MDIKKTNDEQMLVFSNACLVVLMAFAFSLFLPADAFADLKSGFEAVRRTAASLVEPLGTLAIMIIGFMAMFGRVTWSQAIVVAIGIAVVLGAVDIYGDIASNIGGR